MKKAILTCIIAFCATSCMTTVHFSEDEYYTAIYEDTPGTKDQLYLKANQWMVKAFVDANSVIQHNDKEAGVIFGKYLLHGGLRSGDYGIQDTRIYAIIEITVKDNKARIQIKPQGSWSYLEDSMNGYSKEKAKSDIEALAESFHHDMLREVQDF